MSMKFCIGLKILGSESGHVVLGVTYRGSGVSGRLLPRGYPTIRATKRNPTARAPTRIDMYNALPAFSSFARCCLQKHGRPLTLRARN